MLLYLEDANTVGDTAHDELDEERTQHHEPAPRAHLLTGHSSSLTTGTGHLVKHLDPARTNITSFVMKKQT